MANINLLRNGGFEDSALTWWKAQGLTASSSTAQMKSGDRSVLMQPTAAWQYYSQVIQGITISELQNRALAFSCYIRGSATGVKIGIKTYAMTSQTTSVSAGSDREIHFGAGTVQNFSVNDNIFVRSGFGTPEFTTVKTVDTQNNLITCDLTYNKSGYIDVYVVKLSSASTTTNSWEQLTVTVTPSTFPYGTSDEDSGYAVWIIPGSSSGDFYN